MAVKFLCSFIIGCCWLYGTVTCGEEFAHLEAGDQEVPGWGIKVNRKTSEYIDPVRDTSIISGREICEDPKTKIVIVVESTPTSQEARHAIRKSWANLTGPLVKVGFMIGFSNDGDVRKALKNESKMYKDIIEESFIESYYNLTLKGISILKWFVRCCPKAEFLLKADEDTFVDVELLVLRLASFRNSTDVLRGYLCPNFDRDDRLWSKYYAPRYMYRHEKYPDFLQGSAYYMSRDVAQKLFAAAMATPIFHLEDVYITGLCAQKAKVQPKKEQGVVYLFGFPISTCVQPKIITCNSVDWPQLQWVLDERNKLNINYSEIMEEYTSGSEGTIEKDVFLNNAMFYLVPPPMGNSEPVEQRVQLSTNSPARVIKPLNPRSHEVSAATSSLFLKSQPVKSITWFSMTLIFHWLTSLNEE